MTSWRRYVIEIPNLDLTKRFALVQSIIPENLVLISQQTKKLENWLFSAQLREPLLLALIVQLLEPKTGRAQLSATSSSLS